MRGFLPKCSILSATRWLLHSRGGVAPGLRMGTTSCGAGSHLDTRLSQHAASMRQTCGVTLTCFREFALLRPSNTERAQVLRDVEFGVEISGCCCCACNCACYGHCDVVLSVRSIGCGDVEQQLRGTKTTITLGTNQGPLGIKYLLARWRPEINEGDGEEQSTEGLRHIDIHLNLNEA